ncbi:hypothetical protein [Halomonas litopenaei]|uniref:hypothetical protein n=1 Tax=Halomonas litopenaei TaxID=2109328 RepID=UPI001A90BDB8|nr:hypothetical protein [Halomonas litopenaei]MBN8414353.1 hypothetical protein [Halomonas litopenaei]
MTNAFEEKSKELEPIAREGEGPVTNEGQPTPPPVNMKDLSPEEQMKKIKEETLKRLYQNDPVIREGIDAQLAIEASKAKAAPEEPPFQYDAEGNLIGVKPEYKHKVKPHEQMAEIKKNTMRKFGGQKQ